jgi:hypothetical protein
MISVLVTVDATNANQIGKKMNATPMINPK